MPTETRKGQLPPAWGLLPAHLPTGPPAYLARPWREEGE